MTWTRGTDTDSSARLLLYHNGKPACLLLSGGNTAEHIDVIEAMKTGDEIVQAMNERDELATLRHFKYSVDCALNSGDGSYRP